VSTGRFWIVIVVLAVGTFLIRSVPIWLHGRAPMPGWLERLLRHVPAAALTTLVVPASLWLKANGTYTFAPERTLAIAVAAFVAFRWRNMLATLIAGMAALWALQAVM
jgi:branched-subunit amino acid transport protein